MNLDTETFAQFVTLISGHSGIQLADKHMRMLENRIRRRVQDLGLKSFGDYLLLVRDDQTGRELLTLIDAVTTNFTSFFRDPRQFEHFRGELEKRVAERPERIRIWSAACSTGEEIYTLIMVALRAIGEKTVDETMRFLATDIAPSVLQQASEGIYRRQQVERIAPEYQEFFEATDDAEERDLYQVDSSIRERVIFRRLNLCDHQWQVPGEVDFIFLRNVLIYFDVPTQKRILANCASKLRRGGLLYLGASESVRDLIPSLSPVEASVFRRPKVGLPNTSVVASTSISSQSTSGA